MSYPVISTDAARIRTVNGEKAIYIGPVSRYPTYAQWEGQIVTLRDELGEVEVEARLIRRQVDEGERDQWCGVLVSPFRDIAEESAPAGESQRRHPEIHVAS